MNPHPFSPAAERNREPILAVLRRHFADRRRVLEIGSGTGQHAVHFAAHLPHLRWQTSDLPQHHDGIRAWLRDADVPNALPPLALDVACAAQWPGRGYDAAFSANTLHIMGWPEVEAMFAGLDGALDGDAVIAIYGPFNLGGRFTSDSNAAFDAALRAADPRRGIRDLEAVSALAARIGFVLVEDNALPANNRCVVWRRRAAETA